MNRSLIALTLLVGASAAQGEQILIMPSGEQYLGNQTVDHSGIFVDCDKRPHSSADGRIQPTSQRCADSTVIHADAQPLITRSPLEVVSVDPKDKKIRVMEGSTVKILDLKQFPDLHWFDYNKGDQIGIVTDKKSSLGEWILPEAIFGKDFAVDAKQKEDKRVQEQLTHPEKGT
ncbi:hypothetical protein [Pseudomonas putida]|jgi:hypothetical protein|uniref:hypothetical protein n=1 Tax=Pseudomonas putida TaxID=303 RepID=UPI003D98C31A